MLLSNFFSGSVERCCKIGGIKLVTVKSCKCEIAEILKRSFQDEILLQHIFLHLCSHMKIQFNRNFHPWNLTDLDIGKVPSCLDFFHSLLSYTALEVFNVHLCLIFYIVFDNAKWLKENLIKVEWEWQWNEAF